MCKGEGFVVELKVVDKWRGGTDMYRLVDLGCGPMQLQIFNGKEWVEESEQYRWSTLTSRINELRNSQDNIESTNPTHNTDMLKLLCKLDNFICVSRIGDNYKSSELYKQVNAVLAQQQHA